MDQQECPRPTPGNDDRSRIIVRTSVIGIAANLFLVAFKAVVGLVSGSIAVLLDAVNNLSDALSSAITILGTKLANRPPDKKHPLGYGRIEYLSAMIVSAIVLYAGITSLVESIKKIIHPEAADYSVVSLVIIAAAIVVKLLLGQFVKAQGKRADSQSLIASGADASFDAILSASVLASALIYLWTNLSLEAYVGAVISVIIIKSGIGMMLETLNEILGQRSEAEVTRRLREVILTVPEVRGVYDVVIYNYGPTKNLGSVHLELADTMRVDEVDVLSRAVQEKVYRETGIILTGIGVYSYNTSNPVVAEMHSRVSEAVLAHEWALQLHGFYADPEKKTMRFDVVMSFDVQAHEAIETLTREVAALYPEYSIHIAPDVDVSD